jgi:hypothetical protein
MKPGKQPKHEFGSGRQVIKPTRFETCAFLRRFSSLKILSPTAWVYGLKTLSGGFHPYSQLLLTCHAHWNASIIAA